MYWSELLSRDIIDIETGTKLGTAADVDFVIDEETGEIHSMILPARGGLMGLMRAGDPVEVPWSAVYRLGPHVILVRQSRVTGRRRPDSDTPPVGY